jgi:hypothetical protein
MKNILPLLALFTLFVISPKEANAYSLMGRLGMGTSNQFVHGLPAISIKVQRSRNTAFGALMALKSNTDATDYGFGVKLYRIIYDEPKLNFYAGAMLALLNADDKSGFQFDATFGTEFHMQGIESIGFSFEYGISLNKYGGATTFETAGHNIIKAAVHFYL